MVVSIVKNDFFHNGNQLARERHSLNPAQAFIKRIFDIFASVLGLLLFWWLILLAWILASLDTRSNGFFTQERVGREGTIFKVIKIRTMRPINGFETNVTAGNDPRITSLGKLWRNTKIDELPQLINVLKGEMSFVGPRPDVPGYADILEGEDRIVLTVRPGITGPATLKYRNEENLLAKSNNPETYNREIVWPEKVQLNREYVENWSFWQDLKYIWQTIFS